METRFITVFTRASHSPYLEPDECSPYPISFKTDYASIYTLVSQVVYSFWIFRAKFCTHISSLQCVLSFPPI
jgi:hypothetical protein